MRSILIIARLTWQEAQRRKIVRIGMILAVAFVALYSVGLYYAVADLKGYLGDRPMYLNTAFNMFVMLGFYVISFMGVVLSVLASVGALAGEIGSHTIYALAVKPIPRRNIVLGKWLGLTTLLATYISLLWFGVTLSTWLIAHYTPPMLGFGLLLVIGQAEVMIAVSVFGGASLTTVANGVVCFMLYGLAFVGSWLEQLGGMIGNATLVDIGITSSLIVPSEVMWRMAADLMQPAMLSSLNLSPFAGSTAPSPAMLIYAGLYVAAALILAVRTFDRRDL